MFQVGNGIIVKAITHYSLFNHHVSGTASHENTNLKGNSIYFMVMARS